MNCIICDFQMEFYFTKNFSSYDLQIVEYWKCTNCNFVISSTHAELSQLSWEKLNSDYHNTFLGKDFNADDPRWVNRLNAQAEVINDLVDIGILLKNKWLDFASGDGKLSSTLKEKYNLDLLNYDKYMPIGNNFLTENDLFSQKFDFVLTTSVFEHIIKRQDFDNIAALVTQNGIMGLHTLVCENIPNDPNWFYLLPVHCAFHTNKSMSFLLQQWGYKASIYNVDARLWIFFKTNINEIESIINDANNRGPAKPNYLFKNGFVDYWK